MRALFSVFKFEFLNRISQKSIKFTTIFLTVVILAITFIPRFFNVFNFSDSTTSVTDTEEPVDNLPSIGYVVLNDSIDEGLIPTIINFGKPVQYDSEKDLNSAIKSEEVESGYIFESPNFFKEINKNTSLYNQNTIVIQENLSTILRNDNLEAKGIDPSLVEEASSGVIEYETVSLGKSASSGIVFAYLGMFFVYMIVLFFGNSVATLVAREKNDRTMEILITTTSSKNLIVGKVLASTLTSFLQIFIILAAAVIGFIINKSFYPEFIIDIITDGIGLDSLAIFLLFTVLGCLLYFFLFASFGALVSKVEEVGNSTLPIQLIFIAGFILTSSSMQFPDSMLMKILSIFPFTSPLSFFVRYTMTAIPVYEILIAIALLLLTTIILAVISVKIYRMGTLNYGNKMGFFKTVKKLFENED